ncbi:UNVERIFIED_CONTAM: hypothetical protein GTU68_065415 [Idotea baltica]|nr:hypothetical protein [Idotea baltica]
MTPAIETLKKAGVSYQLHEYAHDSLASSYGEEAALNLNIPSARVFKTLVVSCDPTDKTKQLAIAIVPVSHQLNFKAVAKSLSTKKVSMADTNAAQNTTGYILGGISPLGQKKSLVTVIDVSAETFETIYVSGGKRGLEIEIAPLDLLELCKAKFAEIKTN